MVTARLLANCSITLRSTHTNAKENITKTRAKLFHGLFCTISVLDPSCRPCLVLFESASWIETRLTVWRHVYGVQHSPVMCSTHVSVVITVLTCSGCLSQRPSWTQFYPPVLFRQLWFYFHTFHSSIWNKYVLRKTQMYVDFIVILLMATGYRLQRSSSGRNYIAVIPHPPYSPSLAPCDFFLFSRMKGQMKGKYFADVSEVKKKTLEVLNNISTDWRVPEMFSAVGKTLEQVYRVKRRVHWRGLEL